MVKSSKRSKVKHTFPKTVESLLIIAALVTIILAVGLALRYQNFTAESTGNAEKEALPKNNDVGGSIQLQDFPSSEAGTFIGILRPTYFKEPLDNIIILFASVRVPGMVLAYYPTEHKLIGGTPQMVADGITFFDGQSHELKYSFQRNGQQLLIIDGKVVASSPFISYRSTLTGAVAGIPEVFISESFETFKIS